MRLNSDVAFIKRRNCSDFELLPYLFFRVGGWSLIPFFSLMNLLVRVKLGYTPNFAALGHVEVP